MASGASTLRPSVEDDLRVLAEWQSSLSPLRVDIVCDFAGNNLFGIHGESLIAHCVTQANVDFEDGFQLLHAVHAVETFLCKLKQRGGNFHILWFHSHEGLAVPDEALDLHSYKYRLLRAVLINHLNHVGKGSDASNASVSSPVSFVFSTIGSEGFAEYINTNRLHFILCSAGRVRGHTKRRGERSVGRAVVMHQFARRGHSLGFLNHLEFRSTKIYVHVVVSFKQIAHFEVLEAPDCIAIPSCEELASKVDQCYTKTTKVPTGCNDLVREKIVITACASILQSKPGIATERQVAAFLFHLEILQHCDLAQRSLVKPSGDFNTEDESFLQDLTPVLIILIQRHAGLSQTTRGFSRICDLVDGMLYQHVLHNLDNLNVSDSVHVKADLVRALVGIDVLRHLGSLRNCLKPLSLVNGASPSGRVSGPKSDSALDTLVEPKYANLSVSQNQTPGSAVLPFSHPAVDDYLGEIGVRVDNDSESDGIKSKIFQELTHWHTAKKSVDPKHIEPSDWRALRRNQRYMADTIAYSASLTNVSGKNIDPEIIVVQETRDTSRPQKKSNHAPTPSKPPKVEFLQKKPVKAGKHNAKGGKAKALEAAKAIQAEKDNTRSLAVVKFFAQQCHDMDQTQSLVKSYTKANKYFLGLSDLDRETVGSELSLYICNTLSKLIGAAPFGPADLSTIALLRSHATEMYKLPLSLAGQEHFDLLASVLKLPTPLASSHIERPLSFKPDMKGTIKLLKGSALQSTSFQLEHCGPYLERSFESTLDPRVPFRPDAWQRKVLDAIDEDKSLFVVAPTSAGKTFISFYAMKKVLKTNDDDVLVYVAPTKALVNQIAAEVQARFSKSYRKDGRSVWAIHTRDYRVNNPRGCQVLVTVPHILQIMLLSPSNSQQTTSWARRVKRIIFDEVHCIGQAEDGIVWEQLLLLAPCPIIALSATVGNPLQFRDWLAASQETKGFELEMVVHSTRYSDLRKFVYQPPDSRRFEGLEPIERLPIPGLDAEGTASDRFTFVHPVGAMVNHDRDTLNDVGLEPRDCLELWRTMVKYGNNNGVSKGLNPDQFLPELIKKSDVVDWETALKTRLSSWMSDSLSPYAKVHNDLASADTTTCVQFDETVGTTFPLLVDLRSRGALPAIIFNYDRVGCETILFEVLKTLQVAEQKYRDASPEWNKKIKLFESYQKELAKRNIKPLKSKPKRQDDDPSLTIADQVREGASEELSPWSIFDPEAPIDEFSFADTTKISVEELDSLIAGLRWINLRPGFIEALRRGLGVHHAGMNRHYRQAVEILFRKGFLTAVVATGTLALGLNMPCKTVVFAGDSVFLTALNYRQASGRAGRRGFDLLGNVVFHGVPHHRAMEIMSSRLPDLRGQFPISVSLVLRLFNLLHGTNNSEYATKAMHSLLTQTRLYLGGPASKMSIKHHLRFAIEYLRRQHLLSANGVPLNFSGLVSHLYFTENAVFAFHSLLKEGYLHKLCKDIVFKKDERKDLMCDLMTILCHLFCRVPCTHYKDQVWLEEVVHRSPSMVLLPRMPREAETIIRNHNAETLHIFRNYVRTYVEQYLEGTPDNVLPFTQQRISPVGERFDMSALNLPCQPSTVLRSPFAALSGFTDEFKTIHELCETVRAGVFLEEESIPFIKMYPDETPVPFNAYILDFFKHGDMEALVRDNGIKSGDVWFHLKDFSLILATIVTSLTNFLDKRSVALDDMAMIEVQDAGDVLEVEADQQESEAGNGVDAGNAASAAQHSTRMKKAGGKKKVVLDSWNDDEDEETEDEMTSEDESDESDGEGLGADDGKGLVHVYQAFKLLQVEFETNFRKVWA